MNSKEIGEIRRRVRRDRSNMNYIYGCFVNAEKEIISTFRLSTAMMSQNEADKYFGVMRRTLSGAVGKNLIDVTFCTAQVADSPEHKMLMDLRSTTLQDDELRMAFYKKIIEAVSFDESYLILIGCDSYDVPFKSKDDEIQTDASTEVYKYLLCSICPVKLKKPSLRYVAEDKEFHDGGALHVIDLLHGSAMFTVSGGIVCHRSHFPGFLRRPGDLLGPGKSTGLLCRNIFHTNRLRHRRSIFPIVIARSRRRRGNLRCFYHRDRIKAVCQPTRCRCLGVVSCIKILRHRSGVSATRDPAGLCRCQLRPGEILDQRIGL